jgi:hypothetical protein
MLSPTHVGLDSLPTEQSQKQEAAGDRSPMPLKSPSRPPLKETISTALSPLRRRNSCDVLTCTTGTKLSCGEVICGPKFLSPTSSQLADMQDQPFSFPKYYPDMCHLPV